MLTAPGDEPAKGLAKACWVTAVLDGGDGNGLALDDLNGLDLRLCGHVLAPEGAQRL